MINLTTKTDAELDAEIAALQAEKERRAMPSEEVFLLLADVLEAWDCFSTPEAIRNGRRDADDIAAARVLQAALDAARAEDKADDGWIEWHGGECPVPAGTACAVKFRGGWADCDNKPETWSWGHHGASCDIIAYRVVKP